MRNICKIIPKHIKKLRSTKCCGKNISPNTKAKIPEQHRGYCSGIPKTISPNTLIPNPVSVFYNLSETGFALIYAFYGTTDSLQINWISHLVYQNQQKSLYRNSSSPFIGWCNLVVKGMTDLQMCPYQKINRKFFIRTSYRRFPPLILMLFRERQNHHLNHFSLPPLLTKIEE